MSFRCFRLLDAICRQHYINKLCLWKVFRQSTEQWTFEKCKTPLERLGRASKDCVEASFCGTVALYCTIVHYSALYRTVVASCCFMLLHVASCFSQASCAASASIAWKPRSSILSPRPEVTGRWPAGDRCAAVVTVVDESSLCAMDWHMALVFTGNRREICRPSDLWHCKVLCWFGPSPAESVESNEAWAEATKATK